MCRRPPGDLRRAPARPGPGSPGPARWAVGLLAALSGAAFGALPAVPQPVWAVWAVAVVGSSGGQATAGTAPLAPTGVSASCGLIADTVTVSWNAEAGASSYNVYQSTGSGYTSAASGVTGTSWTSPTLGTVTVTYEVTAVVGTYWEGPPSTATAPISVTLGLLCT